MRRITSTFICPPTGNVGIMPIFNSTKGKDIKLGFNRANFHYMSKQLYTRCHLYIWKCICATSKQDVHMCVWGGGVTPDLTSCSDKQPSPFAKGMGIIYRYRHFGLNLSHATTPQHAQNTSSFQWDTTGCIQFCTLSWNQQWHARSCWGNIMYINPQTKKLLKDHFHLKMWLS